MGFKPDFPLALLVQPPVYDFALYDLYLRPYGLLRVGRWLAEAGWGVVFVDGLAARLPRRKPDGTGKFYRQAVETPPVLGPLLRPRVERGEWKKRYARYGMPEEEFRLRVRYLSGEGWGLELPGGAGGEKIISPESGGGPWNRAENTSSLEGVGNDKKRAPNGSGEGRHPDLILIGSGMTYWYRGVAEAARVCREEHPESLLFVGGVYATLLPEHCLDVTGADGVIRGEDLDPLRQALADRGLPVPTGAVPERPIPFPSVWKEAGVIRLNNGCPLRCSYCASRALTPKFRPGDPEKAWEAFRELAGTCGTRNFAFYDDALLYRKEEVFLPFLERVVRWKEARDRRNTGGGNGGSRSLEGDGSDGKAGTGGEARFYLPNGVHVSGLDLPTAQLMWRAGVVEIRLGFESASSDFHRRLDRKVEPEEFPKAIETLKRAGYRPEEISVYLLAGLPHQEWQEVEGSIRFARQWGVKVRIAEYSPVPGTVIWEESARSCPFPLEEPLFHNNSLFSFEWKGFPYGKLLELKRAG